jgi:hypothetical protein
MPAARGMLCCSAVVSSIDRVSARRARLCSYFGEAIPLHLGGDCEVSEFAEKLPAAKLAVSEGGDGWARRVGRGGRLSSPPAALDTLRAPRQDAIKMWGIGGSFVAKNLYSRLHFELGYPLSAAQVGVFVEGGGNSALSVCLATCSGVHPRLLPMLTVHGGAGTRNRRRARVVAAQTQPHECSST